MSLENTRAKRLTLRKQEHGNWSEAVSREAASNLDEVVYSTELLEAGLVVTARTPRSISRSAVGALSRFGPASAPAGSSSGFTAAAATTASVLNS